MATTALMKQVFGIAVCVLVICLATTTRSFAEWYFMVDENPQEVAPGEWAFAVRMPKLDGDLRFVGSQYNFADFTQKIAVDYKFNRTGIDFQAGDESGYPFLAIAPTLYEPLHGFQNGWDLPDLKNRTFRGVVYSDTPLISVYLTIGTEP